MTMVRRVRVLLVALVFAVAAGMVVTTPARAASLPCEAYVQQHSWYTPPDSSGKGSYRLSIGLVNRADVNTKSWVVGMTTPMTTGITTYVSVRLGYWYEGRYFAFVPLPGDGAIAPGGSTAFTLYGNYWGTFGWPTLTCSAT